MTTPAPSMMDRLRKLGDEKPAVSPEAAQGEQELLEIASLAPEAALAKMKTGDKKKIRVEATQAYGPYNDGLVVQIPRTQLPHPDKVKIGDQFSAGQGQDEGAVFTATKISDSDVTLDGNHPLAGQDLTFDVEITEAREATDEEVSHGHAHGADGHHHH